MQKSKIQGSKSKTNPRLKLNKETGFTLLEIMVAVSILAISLLVLLDFHSGAMIVSRRAEDITMASMLARLKLNEIKLDLEKGIDKGEFPAENKTEDGTFDEPYEMYKWTSTINRVDIPVPPQPEGEEGVAGMDIMLKIFQMITEKIAESAREITLEVKWDELGEEQSVSVSTHIVKL